MRRATRHSSTGRGSPSAARPGRAPAGRGPAAHLCLQVAPPLRPPRPPRPAAARCWRCVRPRAAAASSAPGGASLPETQSGAVRPLHADGEKGGRGEEIQLISIKRLFGKRYGGSSRRNGSVLKSKTTQRATTTKIETQRKARWLPSICSVHFFIG